MKDPFPGIAGDDFAGCGPDDLIRDELAKDEKALWIGRPDTGRAFWMTLPFVLFGIPWTLFALFWMSLALGMSFLVPGGGPPMIIRLFLPIFGIPFVLIGLGMLSAPFWLGRRLRRTTYAVTNQRVILWEPGFFGNSVSVTSIPPEDMHSLTKVVRPDGSGDLFLTEAIVRVRRGRPSVSRKGFYGIPQVGEVERLIRSTLLHTR